MKYVKFLLIVAGMIGAVSLLLYSTPAIGKSLSKPDLKRLDSPDITRGELAQYEKYGAEKLSGGVTVKERIDALKIVLSCLNAQDGAERPSEKGLSDAQQKAIRAAFNNKTPETIKHITQGKKFNSINAFLKYLNKIFD